MWSPHHHQDGWSSNTGAARYGKPAGRRPPPPCQPDPENETQLAQQFGTVIAWPNQVSTSHRAPADDGAPPVVLAGQTAGKLDANPNQMPPGAVSVLGKVR
jgi:hypothetical protein